MSGAFLVLNFVVNFYNHTIQHTPYQYIPVPAITRRYSTVKRVVFFQIRKRRLSIQPQLKPYRSLSITDEQNSFYRQHSIAGLQRGGRSRSVAEAYEA